MTAKEAMTLASIIKLNPLKYCTKHVNELIDKIKEFTMQVFLTSKQDNFNCQILTVVLANSEIVKENKEVENFIDWLNPELALLVDPSEDQV